MEQFTLCLEAIQAAYWYLPWIFIGSAVVGAILLLAVGLRQFSGTSAVISDGLVAVVGLILMGMGVFQLVKFGGGEQNLEVQFTAGIHEFCQARGEEVAIKAQMADVQERLADLEERLQEVGAAASRMRSFAADNTLAQALRRIGDTDRRSGQAAAAPDAVEGTEIYVFHRTNRADVASQLVDRLRAAGALSAAQVTDLSEVSRASGSGGVRVVYTSGTDDEVLSWLVETIRAIAPEGSIVQSEAPGGLRTGDIQVQIF